MAIVKAKYVRGKSRIKAHLRYITHRRGVDGERITRPLFGKDEALSKLQIYEAIDAAPRGAVFHKFVINFHPGKEDTRKDLNLWEITRKTLEQIKTQFGESVPFVATIHDDHTALRHIHGFFMVEGRLPKEEFAKIKGLWKVATAEVRRQRKNLDRMRKSLRYQKLLPLIEKYKHKREQGRGRPMREIRMQPACQHCGYGGRDGMPAYILTCPSCKN
jgi:predicted Zn-ribbon and HTH transcriptional regulator